MLTDSKLSSTETLSRELLAVDDWVQRKSTELSTTGADRPESTTVSTNNEKGLSKCKNANANDFVTDGFSGCIVDLRPQSSSLVEWRMVVLIEARNTQTTQFALQNAHNYKDWVITSCNERGKMCKIVEEIAISLPYKLFGAHFCPFIFRSIV